MARVLSLTAGTTGNVCQASGASVGVIDGVIVCVVENTAVAPEDSRVAPPVTVSPVRITVAPFSRVDAGGDPAQAVATIRNTKTVGIVGIFTWPIISGQHQEPFDRKDTKDAKKKKEV